MVGFWNPYDNTALARVRGERGRRRLAMTGELHVGDMIVESCAKRAA
ncbi:MAG: hypothetical protein ACLTMP_05620 [Eggerthella lenta]